MPDFTYTTGLPNPPNNPSADVNGMQTNTNSISGLIAIDHIGFNGSLGNGGKHKQAQLVSQASIPAGLAGQQSTLYSKQSGGAQVFFTPGVTTNEYQLTRANSTDFPLFATNTNYGGANTVSGGWTFLPGQGGPGADGALILQYGVVTIQNQPGLTNVTYPIAFPSGNAAFNIQVSAIVASSSSGDQTASIRIDLGSDTGFQIGSTSSGNVTGFTWLAIGV